MSDSIHLTFSNAQGGTLHKGPYSKFYLQGETLREESGGKTIAVHEDHYWQVGGQRWGRFDCDCPVLIHALRVDGRRTQSYGPFQNLSARDGILFTNHDIFAFADRTLGDWYCHEDGVHWAMFIVETHRSNR